MQWIEETMKIKRLISICMLILMLIMTPCTVKAEIDDICSQDTLTVQPTTDISNYGFEVDKSRYPHMCAAGKVYITSKNSTGNDVTVSMTTRVWILREAGTHHDIILYWTQVSPKVYTHSSFLWFTTKAQAYPELLKVYAYCIYDGVEMGTSSPKNDIVTKSYSVTTALGGSVSGGTTNSISAGITGNVSVSTTHDVNSLIIKNYSDAAENISHIEYDYQPGKKGKSENMVEYCTLTTEQIGLVDIDASKGNYLFAMEFDLYSGHAIDETIYNSDSQLTTSRVYRWVETGF